MQFKVGQRVRLNKDAIDSDLHLFEAVANTYKYGGVITKIQRLPPFTDSPLIHISTNGIIETMNEGWLQLSIKLRRLN